jgi:hypothetical protein
LEIINDDLSYGGDLALEISKTQQLDSVVYELEQLYIKIQNHIEERVSSEGYVYADTYRGWVNEYNQIIQKYNSLTSANVSLKTVSEYELSSSLKTVRPDIAKSFAQSVKVLADKIEADIKLLKNKADAIPAHQMRVCFKTGAKGCPLDPTERKNKVFVAMSFSDEYKDSYEYGVKLVLEQKGLLPYKADTEINNRDIMCKICEQIQSCRFVIANISGLNSNVMLELGLAYGLGKQVIVIKDRKTTTVSDLGSIEYIEYAHAGELQQKLNAVL